MISKVYTTHILLILRAVYCSENYFFTNEWKRRNNKKKNSAEGRERATVHSVLACETVATFLHFTSI